MTRRQFQRAPSASRVRRAASRWHPIVCLSGLFTIISWWLLAAACQAAVPTNSSPPTIIGAATASAGQTLIEVHGHWTPTPKSFTYQWEDCDTAGASCTPIQDAVARRYAPTAADAGHTIVVQETAIDGTDRSAPASSRPTAVVVAPPSNSAPPSISAVAQAGHTLTVTQGTWSDSPSLSDAWQRCDVAGSACAATGATGGSYTLTAADAGHTIIVQETARNRAGQSTASSAPTPLVTVESTTGLLVFPTAPVANQTVTMIATVTASVTGAPPTGTVTFRSDGKAVSGCSNEPVRPTGQSVTVPCQIAFPASTTQLSATFAPAAGSNVVPSASPAQSVTVGEDSTSTSLDVSATANVGASTTYTATVTPPAVRPGPLEPTGSVQFFDGGRPIASCTARALILGGATCTVTYRSPGEHTITAGYSGDSNFTGSASAPGPVTVVRTPAEVLGSITATMQWTFRYTRRYTTVNALVVNGALNANVVVQCQGPVCPFTKHTSLVTRHCGLKATRTCLTPGTVDLTPQFRMGRLGVGTNITVMIVRPRWVGKYYSFTIRAGHGPRIRLSCLAPGGTRPGVGC
jgi:hypothetical protein